MKAILLILILCLACPNVVRGQDSAGDLDASVNGYMYCCWDGSAGWWAYDISNRDQRVPVQTCGLILNVGQDQVYVPDEPGWFYRFSQGRDGRLMVTWAASPGYEVGNSKTLRLYVVAPNVGSGGSFLAGGQAAVLRNVTAPTN